MLCKIDPIKMLCIFNFHNLGLLSLQQRILSLIGLGDNQQFLDSWEDNMNNQ